MNKWTYELNITEDIWRGGIFNTKEEAIREANLEAEINGVDRFKVGIVKEIENIGIDIEFVLERIQAEMYAEAGEIADDYLCSVSKKHEEELENKLNEVFFEWQKKHCYKPTFYNVVSEEIIKVK